MEKAQGWGGGGGRNFRRATSFNGMLFVLFLFFVQSVAVDSV